MNFNLMLVGRTIYGIGCESMYVGKSSLVSEWFINYELPVAIAMISCIPLCGSFANGAIIPSVYNSTKSFGDAFRVGFILCLLSVLMVILIYIIDLKTVKNDAALLKQYKKYRK